MTQANIEAVETIELVSDVVTPEVAEVSVEAVETDVEAVETESVTLNKTTTSDLSKIDPRAISFDHSENIRTDYGDMDSLKNFITANGVMDLPPILVKSNGKDSNGNRLYKLVHGFRRTTAVTELIAEGVDIARMKAIVVGAEYNEEKIVLAHISENSGKPLTPIEMAEGFGKLEKLGWTQVEIATKCGVTPPYVSQLLKLTHAPKAVKDYARQGLISTTELVKMISRNKEDFTKVQAELKAAHTIVKGKKITAKTTEKVTINRVSKFNKLISKDIATMQASNYEERYITKAQKIQEFIDTLDTLEGEARIEALCSFSI